MTDKLDKLPQTLKDKIIFAEALKKEGNGFYKEKNFKKAIRKYKSIFLYITGIDNSLSKVYQKSMGSQVPAPSKKNPPKETEEQAKVRKLLSSAKLNLAICYLNLGKGRRCREYANEVLEEDSENVKALFRRGQGWMKDGFIDNAKKDFMAVLKKCPNDIGVKRALIQLKKRKKEVEKKEKKMYKNMQFD